ncbi:MAG: helix-turn-helix domain-containing protein [bacterium]
MQEKLLTVKEVSELLSVTPWTVYQLVYKKAIPYIKIGKITRFDRNKILRFIEANSHDIIDKISVDASNKRRCVNNGHL